MPTPSGNFTVSSAWRILRHREPSNLEFVKIWTKGLPFKISFFLWRVWKGKVPIDNLWRRGGYVVVSKCWCCLPPQEDSYQHLFLTSDTATKVWRNFTQATGLVINLVQVYQVIREWWNAKCCPKLKPLFQAAPALILWELWKRRNTIKHGGTVPCSRVIHEVNKTLYYMAKVRYPWLPRIPLLWPEMIKFFENYKPVVVTKRVTWQFPYEGWFKCNTDGASRGNPGPRSYGFFVRDHEGNLVFAKAREIGEATNIVAEAKVVVEGLVLCVERKLHPLIMETDSLVMSKIIDDEWETPWCIGAEVRRIKEIRNLYNVLFQHVLREGSKVADFLANLVFSFAGTIIFHSFHEFPSEGKTLINMDKAQIPNLRVRIAKRKAPDYCTT
ncbi:PREDICTED: uncharacterized protein LOC109214596 [Nicotiana attenuata]|uniref:uncharacterized protein LOC109214596 n=1 Tax=Nicotiana attenuata TaxID=49451 RepID=UPI000905994A|nr:PREDICTED: uncharacterized protein LOC109214596 [Nicotiana attenuata]